MPEGFGRIYAIVVDLEAHDVPLLDAAGLVLRPEYAACLDLNEYPWKTLRSLALAGSSFKIWDPNAKY